MSKKADKIIEFSKFGIFSIGTKTVKESLKKSRLTKEVTPDNLKVVYKLMFATVSLGNNYSDSVNNRLAKEGKAQTFSAQDTYTVPYKGSNIVLEHKTKSQKYLRVYPNLCMSFHTRKEYFDAEGKNISYQDWKEIEKEYFSLPSKNKSQNLDDEIIVNNYKLENVIWLKRGSIKIEEIKIDDFKKLLDSDDINPDDLFPDDDQ